MQKDISKIVEKAVENLYEFKKNINIEKPKDLSMGDYTSNISFILAKEINKNPIVIAEEIVKEINKNIDNLNIESVSAISGFINFSLSKKFFSEILNQVLKDGESFGKSDTYKGKNILVEHSSPNLFKPFHIGHMMNNTIGESLVRIARFSGAEVNTMSFPSDISLGVAKAIFILLEEGGDINIQKLGEAYVKGTQRYKDDESVQGRVKEIADNLYAQKDSIEWSLYQKCKKINIEYFEGIISRLGTNFDEYIYESQAGVEGKEIVKKYTPSVFTESEGAVVYIPSEDRKDINTSVFINSQDNPTYEAKDIGLLKIKFDKYNPDKSIFVTDVEQIPHFKVVLAAAEKINKEWSEKSVHVSHGRMSFKGQKMSSRLGGVPLAEEMLAAVSEEVFTRSSKELSSDTGDLIAIAAIKFSILRTAAGKNINFDPETSLSFEGDSGPYLQYSSVRAKSILAKENKSFSYIFKKVFGLNLDKDISEEWQTTMLEKNIIHFPYAVEKSISDWSPHHLVIYLLELAQSFNAWYGNTKIVDGTKEEAYKIKITKAFLQVMKNGLNLLAIKIPERM